jgi:glycerol uptake facilitator-like aquaporin
MVKTNVTATSLQPAARRYAAEGIGSCFLLLAVVGSGIMGSRLAGGSAGLALLANSVATGAALVAILSALGPVSGAHLNPIVTIESVFRHERPWSELPGYLCFQIAGAFAGVAIAHVLFGEPVFAAATTPRDGLATALAELFATFGLILVIRGGASFRPEGVPVAVGCYIAGAYWFTSSTSFANPAVTLARAATNTFTGIRISDVPMFIIFQCAGGGASGLCARWLFPAHAARTGNTPFFP